MRLKGIAAGAALAVAVLPTMASAHWGFSQWGMSPDQVITASKGKAKAERLDYGASIGADQFLASTDHVVEGQQARAEFYFNGGKTLSLVRLVLRDPAGCDPLAAALVKRYGPKSPSGAYFWIDQKAGNIVEFADDRARRGQTCRVAYRPWSPK